MAQSQHHRRKPIERRLPMGAAPPDLYDYAQAGGSSCKGNHTRPEQRIRITDDWPEVVPIFETEIRIIEAYFGDILDELFGPLP